MTKQPSWIDALPKATDKKCEAVIHSASTLNEDGTETEYYNRKMDGHKELSELLPHIPDADDISLIDKLYVSPEDEIKRLEGIIVQLNEKNNELTKDRDNFKKWYLNLLQGTTQNY